MFSLINTIPWLPLCLFCILVGCAPFTPEPHLVEKLRMLLEGNLHKPLDIFDLLFHSAPFLLLALKGVGTLRSSKK